MLMDLFLCFVDGVCEQGPVCVNRVVCSCFRLRNLRKNMSMKMCVYFLISCCTHPRVNAPPGGQLAEKATRLAGSYPFFGGCDPWIPRRGDFSVSQG